MRSGKPKSLSFIFDDIIGPKKVILGLWAHNFKMSPCKRFFCVDHKLFGIHRNYCTDFMSKIRWRYYS